MHYRLFACLALAVMTAAATAESPLDGMTPADLAEGRKAFNVHCARCHGIAGKGGEGSNLVRSKLRYAADDEALLEVIDNGIPGTGMPANWMLDDTRKTQVAAYVRSLGQLEEEDMPGDPRRGAEVYRGKGGCPACHIVAGHGKGIGPELTRVGDRRGLAYLRQSLTDPAATQAQTRGYQDFLTVRIATANRQVEGLRVNEDAFTVQVRDLAGRIHSFRKDELAGYEKVFAHSLMPDYDAALTDTELDDLVSYLMSLRSEP